MSERDYNTILRERPYKTREVLSYYVLPNAQYRAVIVRWRTDRFARVLQSRVAYTAPTVRGLWVALWVNGHIPTATYMNHDAYRTFAKLGRGAR